MALREWAEFPISEAAKEDLSCCDNWRLNDFLLHTHQKGICLITCHTRNGAIIQWQRVVGEMKLKLRSTSGGRLVALLLHQSVLEELTKREVDSSLEKW